jgi:hypothetical protein
MTLMCPQCNGERIAELRNGAGEITNSCLACGYSGPHAKFVFESKARVIEHWYTDAKGRDKFLNLTGMCYERPPEEMQAALIEFLNAAGIRDLARVWVVSDIPTSNIEADVLEIMAELGMAARAVVC